MFLDNKESPTVGSQQVKGRCTFCQKQVISTGATRIVDHLRNRLGHEKANKLVGLFHNLRLMAKMNKTQYVESALAGMMTSSRVASPNLALLTIRERVLERGSYRRTAVVSRVRRIILLHVLLIVLPFVRLLYYV